MSTQRTSSDSDSLGGVKRQLRRWVVRQSVFAGIVVWGLALFVTHPPFGMGGPNYPLAAIVALSVAGVVALVARARAFLHIQRILADKDGSTPGYRLGRMFGGNVRKWFGSR